MTKLSRDNGIAKRPRGGVDPLPVHAKWRSALNDEELQRLSVIEERLTRKRATIDDLQREAHMLMRRGIARNRRKEGKT